MTEIKCPTCGARCEAKVVHGVALKTHMTAALPTPDLTKLREAWKAYKECANHFVQPYLREPIYKAIKELLEQEEK